MSSKINAKIYILHEWLALADKIHLISSIKEELCVCVKALSNDDFSTELI